MQLVEHCKMVLQVQLVEHCKMVLQVQLEECCKMASQELLVEDHSQVLEEQLGGCWRRCRHTQPVACGTPQKWMQAPCRPSLLADPEQVLRLQAQAC